MRELKDFAGRHKGEDVFVYGNGPSLRLAEQHREQLGQREWMGTSLSIGINYSYQLLLSPYYLFSERDFWRFGSGIPRDNPVFCPMEFTRPEEEVKIPENFVPCKQYVPSNGEPPLSLDCERGLRYDRVQEIHAKNSAVMAVNLASMLGAGRVLLLGIDMKNGAHFYSDEGIEGSYPKAEKTLQALEEIAAYLESKGVQCVNCAPAGISIVRGWRFVGLDEVFGG